MKQVERRQKSKKGGREAASWELRNLKFQVEKGESKRKVPTQFKATQLVVAMAVWAT